MFSRTTLLHKAGYH